MAFMPPRADIPEVKLCLAAGFLIVGFPAAFLLRMSLQVYPLKMHGKLMYAGCPAWMRHLTKGLFAVGLAIFFSPLILDLELGDEGLLGPGTSLGLGGFGIAFFAPVFAQAYSAQRLDRVLANRRCPNGHLVSPTARFCEECGQAVPQEVRSAL